MRTDEDIRVEECEWFLTNDHKRPKCEHPPTKKSGRPMDDSGLEEF